jgi:PAS domain S-box-containing protein/diguanylate cyclase (GGDEF)-like protein
VANAPSTPPETTGSSEAALAEMERRLGDPGQFFRSAFENAPIPMALTGLDSSFLAVNRSFCEFIGRSVEDLLGVQFQEISHPDDWSDTVADAQRILAGEKLDHEREKRYLHADGSIVWGLLHTSLARDVDGKPLHFISHVVDITERKVAEYELIESTERLHSLALRDPLTGLRNQSDFREALEAEVSRVQRYGGSMGLGLFDIDGFARINTERGRADGDRILREVGDMLERESRRPDLSARLGADTFGVIFPEVDAARAHYAAERIAAEATELDDAAVSLSFGIAAFPYDGTTSEELLRAAQAELEKAKPESDEDAAVGPRAEARIRRILGIAREQLPLDLSQLAAFLSDRQAANVVETELATSAAPTEGVTTPADNETLIRFLAAVVEDTADEEREARDEREAAAELTGIHALLAALEARDQYTGEHSRIVVQLARGVANELGLDEQQTLEVEQVAVLHDIGKVGIPDSILLKRGPLTDAEWQLMRQHPAVGERVVANTESLSHLAPAIRAEHERYDGGGYPDGLVADEIPIASRITLACDAYHAMTSDRPYRRALTYPQALIELRDNAGTQFDPDVVAALLNLVESDPEAYTTVEDD